MNNFEKVFKVNFLNNGFVNMLISVVLVCILIWRAVVLDGMGDASETPVNIITMSLLVLITALHLMGYVIVQPNQSMVFTFFGKYVGTLRENGFFWINPLFVRKKLSLRARNMDVEPIKVNDKNGNPIMIGLVLVWKIQNTYKATFDIDVHGANDNRKNTANSSAKGYDDFVRVQSDAALRIVAGMYAYDNIDHKVEEAVTLRSGGEEVNDRLEVELRKRLQIAGIEVVEARINYLAYAAEIASVMLKRQQADAILSARERIVEGAVSMVDLALKKLSQDNIVELDEERKAAMVSNLLVVLCAEENASPVINTGTLHQ